MALDVTYTNGVIAVREKYLLGDALLRLCETDAATAFRALCERGFGGGAETANDPFAYEKLIVKEEDNIDAFVREYAPTRAEKAFFLAPNDFHNAKVLLKAKYLGADPALMLAADGLVDKQSLQACFEKEDFSAIEDVYLRTACEEGLAYTKGEEVSGAVLGDLFERKCREHLAKACRFNGTLKKLLQQKTDMQNILIAFRCEDEEEAATQFIHGGTFQEKDLSKLFLPDVEQIEDAFSGTKWQDFISLCLKDKKEGRPPVLAERKLDGFETEYFYERRFELKNSQPFLYYISRRKTECANVRIVMACLLAGFGEAEIKKRLRGV